MNASSRFSLYCNEHLRGTSAIIHDKLFGPFQLSTEFCIVQDLTASQSAITLAMIYEDFDEFCCSSFSFCHHIYVYRTNLYTPAASFGYGSSVNKLDLKDCMRNILTSL